jgi:hypothetical protein
MASLWDILDIDMGANDRSQKLSNLISQLETKNIECSDIILGCQRESLEEGRSDDSKLYNIIPNFKLVNEVLEDKNIERIIFTSANWDLQKRGTIKNMNSTLGLFLQIITSMFEVNVDVENKWVSLSNLRVNRNAFYIKYYKKTRKGQQSGQPTINYKAPNFLKIQIKNNDHFRIITLIGLPSPSKRAQKNVENTTYFGLWKIYQEQMGRNSEKKYFLKHLYKLAFSEDIADLNELFKIQDIGVKIT